MKNKIKILWIILICNLILVEETKSQDCGTQEFPSGAPYVNDFFGGYLKTHRTDYSNGNPIPPQENASFNMLFIFIEFTDETVQSSEWPINGPPTYMNKYLVKDKNISGNFWTRYKDSSVSDYFHELSKGAFHVTGETRYLRTYHSWYHYDSMAHGYDTLLKEIYSRLKADTSLNWLKFDLWSRNNQTNNYVYTPDKYLDMMGLFLRMRRTGTLTIYDNAGYVPLFGPNNFIIYASGQDTVKIGNDRSATGSGFLVCPNSPPGYVFSLRLAMHEFCHYLFGNVHSSSGIMNGHDIFMSGYEKYKLGLLDTLTVNFNSQINYTIGDVSGRNGSPQILRVPITETDFFIIENRRKISSWDAYMRGDTTQGNLFKPTGNYGKGVYIYHNNNINLNYAGNVDIECADGLWNWAIVDSTTPDWSPTQFVKVLLRTSLPNVINNDQSFGFSNSDGISAGPWFSIGKRHTYIGEAGTDRKYTNLTEYWTSRELFGDRWDAWTVGYNEIFSPYSNPNTKAYAHGNSNIFMYYHKLNNDVANLEIYKVNQPFTETEILALTPPSKPTGIIADYYVQTENITRPIITWKHNSEPDMLRADLKKRYKVWRATYTNMNYVPVGYSLIETLDIDSVTAPSYIDYDIIALGSGGPGFEDPVEYPVRYTVEAIDKYGDSSVRSDFGSVIGLSNPANESAGDSHPVLNGSEIPTEFFMSQNYPNTFNPLTNIRYDIPFDNNISIKVYDVLGKEIMIIINEFKVAGRYEVSFEGSNFPSGIYYYKFKAGNFEQIRKMVLLK